MKRFSILFMLLCIFGPVFVFADSEAISFWEDLGIKLSGGLAVQLKYQDSFKTPLDHPQWHSSSKSGANHRSDQNIRSKGYLNFYFGELGTSEWFGTFQVSIDANDPDTETGEYNEGFIDPSFFSFIMYRPFEIQGGRPFGITVGIQTIPQTMNGYYSYLFKGDFFDFDFPANLGAGLISAPAVTLDFHISKDTGIGFTLAKDVSYISEFAAFINPDSATTGVFWFEAKKWGFGFNGAYQRVKGNRGSTEETKTNNGNVYYEYSDKGYYHNIINALISYTIDVSTWTLKPYIGYQAMWGDETPLPDYSTADEENLTFDYLDVYGPRQFEGNLKTIGFTVSKEIRETPNTFAFEFTKVDVPDLDGIGGLKKGTVDQYLIGLPKSSIAGYTKSLLNFADLDFVICVEHGIKITKNITFGSFAYSLKSKDDRTIGNATYIRNQLVDKIGAKLIRESGISAEDAPGMAEGIVTMLESTPVSSNDGANSVFEEIVSDTRAAEWTDTYAIGCYISYTF